MTQIWHTQYRLMALYEGGSNFYLSVNEAF